MPWRELRPMDQRQEFVREYRRGLYTMTEMAERYDISRKAGYLLLSAHDRQPAHALRLTCYGLNSVKGEDARPIFERTFREYGLPRAICTNNAAPGGDRPHPQRDRVEVICGFDAVAWVLRSEARFAERDPPARQMPMCTYAHHFDHPVLRAIYS